MFIVIFKLIKIKTSQPQSFFVNSSKRDHTIPPVLLVMFYQVTLSYSKHYPTPNKGYNSIKQKSLLHNFYPNCLSNLIFLIRCKYVLEVHRSLRKIINRKDFT